MPRSSSEVYSFEETPASPTARKKRKAPALAQLDCFDKLLTGFEAEVQATVAERKSPAAFFASCNLEVACCCDFRMPAAAMLIRSTLHIACRYSSDTSTSEILQRM